MPPSAQGNPGDGAGGCQAERGDPQGFKEPGLGGGLNSPHREPDSGTKVLGSNLGSTSHWQCDIEKIP